MKSSRRSFIQSASVLGGGLAFTLLLPTSLKGKEEKSSTTVFEPTLLMQIGEDGILKFKYSGHEMGQGSFTGLTMIFADELGADWQKVEASQANYDEKYREVVSGSGGSGTILRNWNPLRELAATARMMLIATAAEQWKVKEEDCYAENSFIVHRPSERKLSFGELAEGASLQTVPTDLQYRSPEDYTIIGTSKKNLITDEVVDGALTYPYDVKVPNMVYAAIARSPIFRGQIKNYTAEKALQIKGVLEVIPITKKEVPAIYDSTGMREGVAIIAENTWAAFEAKKQLEVEWEGGELANTNMDTLAAEMEAAIDSEPFKLTYSSGEVAPQMEKAAQVFSRSYTNPFQTHAIMEPLSATADFRGDSCEIWSSHQFPKSRLGITAKAFGLSMDKIHFYNLPCGGSFGRRGSDDFITEAVFLSKKIKRPVKVVWSREDDIRTGGYHQYQVESHSVGLDEQQNIIAWKQQSYTCTQENYWQWAGYQYQQYYNTHRLHEIIGVRGHLPIMPWRSVKVHQNGLGVESFIDELAHELGKDPLQYRLDLVNNHQTPQQFTRPEDKKNFEFLQTNILPAAKRVYEKMRSLPAWTSPLKSGHARGVAGYSWWRTFAGQIAEVSVINGKLKIHKITCVVDCGTVINPHLAQGQIEGAIIWGLSTLLYNKITLKDGRVEQSNFHDYPVLRIDKTPEIEVIFLDSDEPPAGVGEPAVPPLAPAVLNAIFAATGKRIRELPIGELI